MKSRKEITEQDMELIEKKIDSINIKMINWKYEILNIIFRTRNILISIFVILALGVILIGITI